MTVESPKYKASHPDRSLSCQEVAVQRMIDEMTSHGGGTIEAVSAMTEVLKSLPLAYAEDPASAKEPVKASAIDADFIVRLYSE